MSLNSSMPDIFVYASPSQNPRLKDQMRATLSPLTPNGASTTSNSNSSVGSNGRRRSQLHKRKNSLEQLPSEDSVDHRDDDDEVVENPRKRATSLNSNDASMTANEILELGDVVDVAPRTFPGT